ncbi:phosphoserine transaminase [Spizellomyces punctatus DAOM BR117]|uniref:Phosphoserine aminotransferase n=1 Tax=Spizellomyces punctatus (strain DAOM BR117) TaxID=645134 RepID=A0A0L0HUV0_SPIPD|nr:phosphoserine transaminase [Spizellomyces punctatus DAOM BR117]KND04877.1 phosphoserine transaminase [Spizellomyces punctatus DAOM BR117]|eukprot:XP_016612916.1 phosphoserine transaminase [Spizellomyces punctatus DAOM BR117]
MATFHDERSVWNFSAGPAVMPQVVLERAAAELPNWNNTGMSVMELSHRSPEFESILASAESDLRKLLNIPSTYKILWMQGGATSQFSTLFYNLLGDPTKTADYLVTGGWSEKAMQEAARLGAKVNAVVNTKSTGHNGAVPPPSEYKFTPAAESAYVYYCDNETVHGVEFPSFPEGVPEGVPVVCDMSSNILSRKFDVTKYGIIFAGAQKNIGPAGVTVVIIREDLIGTRMHPNLKCPVMLDFKVCADNGSMYNTPPTYGIYMAGLVFKWLLEIGGVDAIESINAQKSGRLYDAIDSSNGFYRCPVQKGFRSRMNITFRIFKNGAASKDLEADFLKGAEKLGMVQLKGHRSVGGIRASLYNAMSQKGVDALITYMQDFARQHSE